MWPLIRPAKQPWHRWVTTAHMPCADGPLSARQHLTSFLWPWVKRINCGPTPTSSVWLNWPNTCGQTNILCPSTCGRSLPYSHPCPQRWGGWASLWSQRHVLHPLLSLLCQRLRQHPLGLPRWPLATPHLCDNSLLSESNEHKHWVWQQSSWKTWVFSPMWREERQRFYNHQR